MVMGQFWHGPIWLWADMTRNLTGSRSNLVVFNRSFHAVRKICRIEWYPIAWSTNLASELLCAVLTSSVDVPLAFWSDLILFYLSKHVFVPFHNKVCVYSNAWFLVGFCKVSACKIFFRKTHVENFKPDFKRLLTFLSHFRFGNSTSAVLEETILLF